MLLTCSFRSLVLDRNTQIQVILPTPTQPGEAFRKELPVLYLLHGLHGDENVWLHNTSVRRLAEAAGIAVVMPSVNNSFYQDMAHGDRFFTYVSRELPEFVQNLFPVSRRREDTFIAGLSMGGYGALYIGLSRPEQYGAIASFSGAVDIGFRVTPVGDLLQGPVPSFLTDCFGDVTKLRGSDRDIFSLFEAASRKGLVPRLYQSCGTADFLYRMNKNTCTALRELGADILWRETEGMAHEWDFWDQEIRAVLPWLLAR